MPTLGERLAEERERLGLTQTALAESCGVTMRSQRNYEKGERSPDALYLAALVEAGADVLYVVSGRRGGVATGGALAGREKTLLANYRATDQEGRRAVERQAMLEAQRQAPAEPGPEKKAA